MRWIPYGTAHAAAPPRCRTGHTTRPTASPAPIPPTTPSSDHQTTRGPRYRCVVISPARCPLEPVDLSLKNFDLSSSEGIITSDAPPRKPISSVDQGLAQTVTSVVPQRPQSVTPGLGQGQAGRSLS